MFIIIAGTLWGFMGLFVRAFTQSFGFTSGQVTTIRLVVAALMFIAFTALRDKSLFSVRRRDLWVFLCLGFFSIYCMTAFYFKSMTSDTSVSVSAILLYTAPIIVMVASCILFREKFTKVKLLALILAFSGCILVCLGDNAKVTPAGFLYGLASGFAYASYSIFGKIALQKGYSSYTISTYAFITAAIISLIADRPDKIIFQINALMPNAYVILLVFLTALVSAFLPFIFYTKGLERTPAGKASVMASVEPLVATVCGLFLGEKITLWAILGIVSILTAVIILNVRQKAG